jgi:hypothetical protein
VRLGRTLYQLIVPPEAAAKATDPESQREFGVVEVIVGIGLIVAMTSSSTVGQLPLLHPHNRKVVVLIVGVVNEFPVAIGSLAIRVYQFTLHLRQWLLE